jgi:DNA-directed RNA polymerase sigma subunit (sigma70/sigma32)
MENNNSEQLDRMKKYLNAVMDTVLTERQREVVNLFFALDKPTFEKIAEETGTTRQVAHKTFKEAMKKLEIHKKIFLKLSS